MDGNEDRATEKYKTYLYDTTTAAAQTIRSHCKSITMLIKLDWNEAKRNGNISLESFVVLLIFSSFCSPFNWFSVPRYICVKRFDSVCVCARVILGGCVDYEILCRIN